MKFLRNDINLNRKSHESIRYSIFISKKKYYKFFKVQFLTIIEL